MELILDRSIADPYAPGTPGNLSVNGQWFCFTLEDPVREQAGVPVSEWKIRGETAIPAGRYRLLMTPSPRFKRVMLHIMDVPGFAGIRIHNGDGSEDTEGCPLVNYRRHPKDEFRLADYDKTAMRDLEATVQAAIDAGDEVWITVRNPETVAI